MVNTFPSRWRERPTVSASTPPRPTVGALPAIVWGVAVSPSLREGDQTPFQEPDTVAAPCGSVRVGVNRRDV
jgi:hypothetical protein